MDISDLRRRAESGSVYAQAALGICYLEGIDVVVDHAEAFRLLSLAAAQGIPRAAFHLARMYELGLGIPKDSGEALRLYRLSAEKGEFLAQVELGRMYSRGSEVPRDEILALKWYSAAIAQEGRVAACPELEEARKYVRHHGHGT